MLMYFHSGVDTGRDRTGRSAADADGRAEDGSANYVERHRHERDAEGRALVVHNGRSQGRKLTLGAGMVELKTPRVNAAMMSKASAIAAF